MKTLLVLMFGLTCITASPKAEAKNKVEEIESKVNIMFRRDKYMSCVSVCLLCVKMSPQIGSDNP